MDSRLRGKDQSKSVERLWVSTAFCFFSIYFYPPQQQAFPFLRECPRLFYLSLAYFGWIPPLRGKRERASGVTALWGSRPFVFFSIYSFKKKKKKKTNKSLSFFPGEGGNPIYFINCPNVGWISRLREERTEQGAWNAYWFKTGPFGFFFFFDLF